MFSRVQYKPGVLAIMLPLLKWLGALNFFSHNKAPKNNVQYCEYVTLNLFQGLK